MSYTLITGASKGIGQALAVELAQKKKNLILVARSETELEQLATRLQETYSIKAIPLAVDLSSPEGSQTIYNYIERHGLAVDTLINNAGYAVWGNFESNDLSEQNKMLQLNMQTVVNLTHLLLPVLKREQQAYILNIGSTSAYQALPTLALYAASKSFIVAFSRALNFEFRHSNVSVTCVSPGPVNTNFVNRAGMQAIAETAEKFGMNADVLAKKALRAMYKKRVEYVPGFSNQLGVFFAYYLPKRWVEFAASTLYTKK